MKLEIEKIKLGGLEDFVQSEKFNRFSVIPITELRVISYLNNPHSHPDDVVLYLGFVQKQLVAFRSLFAGSIQTENKKIRFGWCSGNWVHPDFRRKGFSEQLLNEAFNDWDRKLMFTNYAPNSENLYLKSGYFQPIYHFDGFRGYLFPKTRKLVGAANKNEITKQLFSATDKLIEIFSELRVRFFSTKANPDIRFEIHNSPDAACLDLASDYALRYLFARGKIELNWIFQFPWITSDEKTTSKKYPFSSWSDSFFYYTIKIFVKDKFAGFFIFSVREGHLKTLHFCVPRETENEIAGFLKLFCVNQKIEMITVYNYGIAKHLFVQKFPFLHAKKYGQKIYSSFEINEVNKYLFQDGDGDVIFT